MSKTIIELVGKAMQSIAHPRTKKSLFPNMDKIFIEEKQGYVKLTILAAKGELMLFESLKSGFTENLLKISGVEKIDITLKPEEKTKYKFHNIKKIIVIASGKGGVGKSTLAANIATLLGKNAKVGLLDADIYGPSIAKIMGKSDAPEINENNHFIPLDAHGIKFMSSECFLQGKENATMAWRGPMLVKMLYSMLCSTVWGELDYLIIDTPPGTGDIHLSLCENFVLDGVILCSIPQMLAIADVEKSANMLIKMNTKILGLIENMSYLVGLDGEKEYIFGDSNAKYLTQKFNIPLLAQVPIIPEIAHYSDIGIPAALKNKCFEEIVSNILKYISAL